MTFYCNKVGEILCKKLIFCKKLMFPLLTKFCLNAHYHMNFNPLFNTEGGLFVKKHFNLRESSYVHQSFDKKFLNDMTYHLKYCRYKAVNV